MLSRKEVIEFVAGEASSSEDVEKALTLLEKTWGISRPKEATEDEKKQAIKLKNEGNLLLKQKKYRQGIEKYSEAIALDSRNVVFYSNRSAAFSYIEDYASALKDGLACTRIDKTYAKGWVRAGFAAKSLEDYPQAKSYYETALALTNEKDPLYKRITEALDSIKEEMMKTKDPLAAFRGLGGMGGAGGAEGQDPFGSMMGMMQDPQFRQMAAQFMGSPEAQNMAKNMMSGENNIMMKLLQNPEILKECMESDIGKKALETPKLKGLKDKLEQDPSAMMSVMGDPEVLKIFEQMLSDFMETEAGKKYK